MMTVNEALKLWDYRGKSVALRSRNRLEGKE